MYIFSSKRLILAVLILIACAGAGFWASGYTGNALYGTLDKVGLHVKHTSLTELYFTDYSSFPSTLRAGQVLPIDFTIRNAEGEDKVYPYEVYLLTTTGARIDVVKGSAAVFADGDTTISAIYTFNTNSPPVQVVVELLGTNTYLHAIIPSRT